MKRNFLPCLVPLAALAWIWFAPSPKQQVAAAATKPVYQFYTVEFKNETNEYAHARLLDHPSGLTFGIPAGTIGKIDVSLADGASKVFHVDRGIHDIFVDRIYVTRTGDTVTARTIGRKPLKVYATPAR